MRAFKGFNKDLTCRGLCSSTYGYWYSRDPDDISTTLSRLVGQVDNMQKVIAGLNRILQEVQDEQKES